MTLWSLKLYTAARKNCWESEAGWTLRNLERANAHPQQNPAAYVARDRIVDITDAMREDGTLEWTVPEGRWTILAHRPCQYRPAEFTGPSRRNRVGVQ